MSHCPIQDRARQLQVPQRQGSLEVELLVALVKILSKGLGTKKKSELVYLCNTIFIPKTQKLG